MKYTDEEVYSFRTSVHTEEEIEEFMKDVDSEQSFRVYEIIKKRTYEQSNLASKIFGNNYKVSGWNIIQYKKK